MLGGYSIYSGFLHTSALAEMRFFTFPECLHAIKTVPQSCWDTSLKPVCCFAAFSATGIMNYVSLSDPCLQLSPAECSLERSGSFFVALAATVLLREIICFGLTRLMTNIVLPEVLRRIYTTFRFLRANIVTIA